MDPGVVPKSGQKGPGQVKIRALLVRIVQDWLLRAEPSGIGSGTRRLAQKVFVPRVDPFRKHASEIVVSQRGDLATRSHCEYGLVIGPLDDHLLAQLMRRAPTAWPTVGARERKVL
jgi:hypothetical protein